MNIEKIEGIGPTYAASLKKADVRTTGALLKKGASKRGREELARKTGLSEVLILEWVNRADLMRVRGVGEEYSDLLEAAGVDTVKELRRRNPGNLLASMVKVNTKMRLVRRLPTEAMVERWVEHAQNLEVVIKY